MVPVPRWFHEREEDESSSHPLTFEVPTSVRVKVVPVLRGVLPLTGAPYDNPKWDTLIDAVRVALGARELRAYRQPRGLALRPHFLWQNFLEDAPKNGEFFTAVEVTLEFARQHKPTSYIAVAVEQINGFLGADHCGFRLIDTDQRPKWRAIRIDSELDYEVTIQRPLLALSAAGFKVAEDQFVEALRKRTEGDYAGAITDANSAMESVIKRILGVEKGQGVALLKDFAKAGYLPEAMENKLGPLGEIFSLVPAERNDKSSAHGRLNPDQSELPRYADLVLGLAGTFIGFVMSDYKSA
jgi:hypothetical protein